MTIKIINITACSNHGVKPNHSSKGNNLDRSDDQILKTKFKNTEMHLDHNKIAYKLFFMRQTRCASDDACQVVSIHKFRKYTST